MGDIGHEHPYYFSGNIDFSDRPEAKGEAVGARGEASDDASAALVGTLAEAPKALANPDLARLVEVWPLLPGDLQDVILATVNGWLMEAREAQEAEGVR